MTQKETIEIVLSATSDRPEELADAVNKTESGRAIVTEQSNLDGSAGQWMMIASVATVTLPYVVDLLKTWLSSRPDTKLKIGDWEVTNPTPEMVEEFMRRSQQDPS